MPPLRIIALLTLFAHPLLGGVVFDGSLGKSGPAPFAHNNFTIPASFGTQRGGNLFQSFSQFSLIKSQSATFCGPPNVQNILARVTSGTPSSIDGTIKIDQTMGDANLFFMNPAGVLFGKNAQVDVKGSFAVTTANYLKLVGAGRFNANLGGGDVLTSAPVSAFGFLSSAPAPVSISGSNTFDSTTGTIIPGPGLRVAAGKSLSVVAGDIAISRAYITGEGSRVNLVSVKSFGEVQLSATNIDSAVDVSQFSALGTINLVNLALIKTSGPGGGPVFIGGGNLNLNNSQILSDTLGSIQGMTIDIDITGSIKIDPGGLIQARTYGKGYAGDVTVNADSLLIDAGGVTGGAGIFARAESDSSGKGGNITVQVDNVKITNGGRIAATTAGFGDAGDVILTAESFLIGGGLRAAIAANGEIGKGGNVTLRAENVKITDGGRIAAITQGSGDAGDVTVEADSLLIDGMGLSLASTGIVADVEAGCGNGGSVTVQAHDAKIIDGGLISARTFAKGDGGNVLVNADSLLIEGVESGILAVAMLGSSGRGGDVVVSAGDLSVQNEGTISAASLASGAAGSVDVRLGTLKMDSGGSISSANTGSGDAGSVTVNSTGPMTVKDGSRISTESTVGNAGNIELTSGGEIKLKDQSSITASAGVNGGNIKITTPDLVYLLNSSITATAGTNGVNGAGGNIATDSQFIVLNNSLISANAAVGLGGNINLVSDFFFNSDLSNNNITATGTTNGSINITAPALDLGAELITLPTSTLSAENQLQERCATLLRGDFSSFISIGRGGTEPAPEELQMEF